MNHVARRAANGRLRGEELAELRENLEREVEHNRQRTQLQLERTRVRRAEKRRQQRLARGAERVGAKLQFNHEAATERRRAIEQHERLQREAKVQKWMSQTGQLPPARSLPALELTSTLGTSVPSAGGGTLDMQAHFESTGVGARGPMMLPPAKAVVRRVCGGLYERVHSAMHDVAILRLPAKATTSKLIAGGDMVPPNSTRSGFSSGGTFAALDIGAADGWPVGAGASVAGSNSQVPLPLPAIPRHAAVEAGSTGRTSELPPSDQALSNVLDKRTVHLQSPVPVETQSGTVRLGPFKPPIPHFAKPVAPLTDDEKNTLIDLAERKANKRPVPGTLPEDDPKTDVMDEMERFDAYSGQFRLEECVQKARRAALLAADAAWAAVRTAESAIDSALLLRKRRDALLREQAAGKPQNRIRIRSTKEMLAPDPGPPRPRAKEGSWPVEGRRRSRLFFSSFSTSEI